LLFLLSQKYLKEVKMQGIIDYVKSLFSTSSDASMKRWMACSLITNGIIFIYLHPDQAAGASALIIPGCALLGVAAFTKS
jgi:hypothetical protein